MRYFAAALTFLLLAVAAPQAAAQPFPRGGEGGQMQSLDSIINNIRRSFPGQVSDVQGPFGGTFRVKWLTPDGRVLWITVDARTGRILGEEGGGGGGRNFGPGNFGPPNFDRGQAFGRPRGLDDDDRPATVLRPQGIERPRGPRGNDDEPRGRGRGPFGR